jgi:hypothetical protein
MSYLHSKPSSLGEPFAVSAESLGTHDQSIPFVQSTDGAIEAALRGVPLPEGLLNRLHRLALTIPDEAAGRMDYLGC